MNLYHRKDGRWEGRIPKPREKGEKRGFHYFLGRTCEAVQKQMEKFKGEFFNQKHASVEAIGQQVWQLLVSLVHLFTPLCLPWYILMYCTDFIIQLGTH